VYYRIDSSRVTLEEYGWGSPKAMLPLVALLKVLRVRLPSSTDDPPVAAVAPFEVAAAALPAAVRERLLPLATELDTLGFVDPLLHAFVDPNTATRVDWATFRHLSGRAVARLHRRLWSGPQPPRERLFTVVISAFADGGFLVTSGGQPDLAAPATCQVERRVGAAPTELWEQHRRVLAAAEAAGRRVVELADDAAVRDLAERHHQALRDFHLARGVFAVPKQEEQAATAAAATALQAAEARGDRFAGELAAIEKLEQGKSSWLGGLLLLGVSLALFLGLGAAQWSLDLVLALLPILLLHEAGHYVAMRVFDYRNVRMFFIPLFGAAVTGRNPQAPGWKRVLVSLAGPLPGIALALPLGLLAATLHSPELGKVAVLMVILNALNLLPLLPLDGGWVMNALVFSRHPALDVAARVAAALGLFGLGLATGDRLLPYLTIPLLISLPTQWRVAKAAADLRVENLPLSEGTAGRVPRATLERILERLTAPPAKPLARQLAAQQTMAVVDTLGARPPGWPATVGLLALYGASLVAAAVILIVLVVMQNA
jgi:Zn-dependent protease